MVVTDGGACACELVNYLQVIITILSSPKVTEDIVVAMSVSMSVSNLVYTSDIE